MSKEKEFYTVLVKGRLCWRRHKVVRHYEEKDDRGVSRLVLMLLNGEELLLGDSFGRDIIFGSDFFKIQLEKQRLEDLRAAEDSVRAEARAKLRDEVKQELDKEAAAVKEAALIAELRAQANQHIGRQQQQAPQIPMPQFPGLQPVPQFNPSPAAQGGRQGG